LHDGKIVADEPVVRTRDANTTLVTALAEKEGGDK
jgi:hypothetical protein